MFELLTQNNSNEFTQKERPTKWLISFLYILQREIIEHAIMSGIVMRCSNAGARETLEICSIQYAA